MVKIPSSGDIPHNQRLKDSSDVKPLTSTQASFVAKTPTPVPQGWNGIANIYGSLSLLTAAANLLQAWGQGFPKDYFAANSPGLATIKTYIQELQQYKQQGGFSTEETSSLSVILSSLQQISPTASLYNNIQFIKDAQNMLGKLAQSYPLQPLPTLEQAMLIYLTNPNSSTSHSDPAVNQEMQNQFVIYYDSLPSGSPYQATVLNIINELKNSNPLNSAFINICIFAHTILPTMPPFI